VLAFSNFTAANGIPDQRAGVRAVKADEFGHACVIWVVAAILEKPWSIEQQLQRTVRDVL
jgi:hypothetical protein